MTAREESAARREGSTSRPPSWRDVLGIDVRALGVLRVGIGVVLLADLALRATDLTAHYTDLGVLPRALLMHRMPDLAPGSLHFHASGSPEIVAALFILHAAFALALLLGWRSRLFTVLCWALVVSLHKRTPFMVHGGDQLLSMLLFWGMFLPLGARYSLDARRARKTARGAVCSLAGAALLLQVALVYWLSLLLRTTPIWWEGEALHYALHLDFWVTRAGLFLRDLSFLHSPLTYLTLLVEGLAPLLCFVPRWARWGRPLAFLLFAGLHTAFGLFLSLGTFPWVSVLSWVVFLPAWVWDRVEAPRSGVERPAPWIRSHPLVDASAAVFLVIVVALNLQNPQLPFGTRLLPEAVVSLGRHLGIRQPWTMFTPNPPVRDGWFLFEGRTSDGERVDLLNGGPSRGFRRPELVTETFPSHRWNIFLFWARATRHHRYLHPTADYLCREGHWPEGTRDAADRSVRVWLFSERTPAPGGRPPPAKRTRVLTHSCDGRSQVRSPGREGDPSSAADDSAAPPRPDSSSAGSATRSSSRGGSTP